MPNLDTYDSPEVVARYEQQDYLLAPEQRLLERLAPRLNTLRMLDLGVGAGRTTVHFAPRVGSYVGLDYAPQMVAACERRFPGQWPFVVGDVRDLSQFADASFDLVLFSYNGLDSVPLADREQALAEIRRVCAPGAVYAGSFHNLTALPGVFRFAWSWSPRPLVWEWRRWRGLRQHNPGWRELLAREVVEVFDGPWGFRIANCYTRPSKQAAWLRAAGFGAVELLALETGEPVPSAQWDTVSDAWLHYVAVAE